MSDSTEFTNGGILDMRSINTCKVDETQTTDNTFYNTEDNTMKNNTNTLTNVNNTEDTTKRVSYSETMTKEIKKGILNGMTFEQIKEKFGVQKMCTIKTWLLRYYTRKKKLAMEIYDMMKANKRLSHAKVPYAVMVDPAAEINTQENVDAVEAPDFKSFEDWYGGPAEVDILIDSEMSDEYIDRSIDYCEKNGYTFKFSTCSFYLNIEAVFLGKPKVITSFKNKWKYCHMDDIGFIWAYHLPEAKSVVFEDNDPEFSKGYTFESLQLGKNGVLSGFTSDLSLEFKKIHSITDDSSLTILVDGSPVPYRIGVKDNSEVIFIHSTEDKLSTWKYNVKGGIFREIGFAEGPKHKLLRFVKRA